jgi:phosphatidylserine decarboxylase
VRVSSVDGDIRFNGAVAPNGSYAFKTHDGNISIRPVGALNATVTVSTWSGEFESAMPVTISGSQEGKRFSFTMGTGSARIELEAFDGLIRLEK